MEVLKNDTCSFCDFAEKNKMNSDYCCLYKNKKQNLFFDKNELRLILKIKGGEVKELSFIEFVRFIDTRADKNEKWKKNIILSVAASLGFFGV